MTVEFPPDRETIEETFLRYLESVDQFGNDMLPTRRNAELFARMVLIPAWERSEPILIARSVGQIVGATFTTLAEEGFEWRERYAIGHGTWVHEEYRQQGVARLLLEAVRRMLKEEGITVQLGMAHRTNRVSAKAFGKMGFKVNGKLLRADL